MIRIVTRTRLTALQQEADQARARSREVQASADAAYARHVRTAWNLTAEAEAAERAAETERADAVMVRELLECTEALLASARATVAEQTAQIEALSKTPADASMVLLLHYGQPHSIHPDKAAAYAYAATLGAPSNGWVPVGERLAAELRWMCTPFIYDAGRDHFRSVAAPVVEASGGAA
ncbi:hypothetical protein ACFY0Z_08085 [Streptomyces kronopolitis]|uniref:hypothetical protein n=1 Tax=Streptomyces kronopolitis TaxID=1612435 RepID=UPI0036C77475